jgi:hypothetical protein
VAFESKRLYVQLPCEDTSLVEKPAQVVPPTFCPQPSVAVFTPGGQIPVCPLVSVDQGIGDPDELVVSPETLGLLKRVLEMRLAMVKDAEAALARNASADAGGGQ